MTLAPGDRLPSGPPARWAGLPLVVCTDVARTYGQGPTAVVALHGATATLHRDSRTSVLGPAGSGKSTLLHVMAGLVPVTAGQVRWPAFAGEPALHPRRLTLLAQSPNLLEDLDVADNVGLPLTLAGVDPVAARRRAREVLREVGAGDLADRWPAGLASSLVRQLALARALVGDPLGVLADEPTAGLAPAAARDVLDLLLAAVDRRGAAVLVATEDPWVAAQLPQRWRLDDGSLMVPGAAHREAST